MNSKYGLFIPKEFLDAEKLRTLQGANQNSSSDESESSDPDLSGLERESTVLVLRLKFQKLFTNHILNLRSSGVIAPP